MEVERVPFDEEQEPDIPSLEEARKIIAALTRAVAEERRAKEAALEREAQERARRREAEERAEWDPLLETMLNQRAVKRHITERILEGDAFAILLADLDNFKGYNDTYGHQAGDDLLLLIEELLNDLRRANDRSILARIGGDEILILLKIDLAKGGERSPDPKKQIENVRRKVEQGLWEREPRAREVGVGVSVGSFIFDPQKSSPSTYTDLKNEADKELYKDKRRRHGKSSSR